MLQLCIFTYLFILDSFTICTVADLEFTVHHAGLKFRHSASFLLRARVKGLHHHAQTGFILLELGGFRTVRQVMLPLHLQVVWSQASWSQQEID